MDWAVRSGRRSWKKADVNHYYLLGRSGLRVSRLALGTMNFGVDGFHQAYGKTEDEAEPIFRAYVESGGNFIDTADFYTAGESERILGGLVKRAGNRERLVLTSKFTNSIDPGDPNASGNGRKHIIRAVEASLRRLGTDYLDLYLLHTWDRITPVEEVVRTLDDLVRAGKYQCAAGGLDGAGRLTNPGAGRAPVTEREWQIIETLGSVATGLGRPMAQVAINWVATQPGVGSVVLGASSAAQVQSNLAALDFEIPADARRLLDEASATPPGLPYAMFTPEYQSWIVSPGLGIGDKPVGYHRPVLNAPLTSRS